MEKRLSIRTSGEEVEVNTTKSDVAASLIRGIVGAAPFVGPLMAEALSATIPNQKFDRMITFMKVLEDRVQYIEEDLLNEKFKNEEFMDLLEDGLQQASRAISEERKEYIANLLKNGLESEKQSHLEKKKILSLLGQLNDAEIIMLKYFSLENEEERMEVADKHPFLKYRDIAEDRLLEEVISEEVSLSYLDHLIQLRLAKAAPSDTRYEITYLGHVLLWYIGQEDPPENFNTQEMNDSLDPFPRYRLL